MTSFDSQVIGLIGFSPHAGLDGPGRQDQVDEVLRLVGSCKRCLQLRIPCSRGFKSCDEFCTDETVCAEC